MTPILPLATSLFGSEPTSEAEQNPVIESGTPFELVMARETEGQPTAEEGRGDSLPVAEGQDLAENTKTHDLASHAVLGLELSGDDTKRAFTDEAGNGQDAHLKKEVQYPRENLLLHRQAPVLESLESETRLGRFPHRQPVSLTGEPNSNARPNAQTESTQAVPSSSLIKHEATESTKVTQSTEATESTREIQASESTERRDQTPNRVTGQQAEVFPISPTASVNRIEERPEPIDQGGPSVQPQTLFKRQQSQQTPSQHVQPQQAGPRQVQAQQTETNPVQPDQYRRQGSRLHEVPSHEVQLRPAVAHAQVGHSQQAVQPQTLQPAVQTHAVQPQESQPQIVQPGEPQPHQVQPQAAQSQAILAREPQTQRVQSQEVSSQQLQTRQVPQQQVQPQQVRRQLVQSPQVQAHQTQPQKLEPEEAKASQDTTLLPVQDRQREQQIGPSKVQVPPNATRVRNPPAGATAQFDYIENSQAQRGEVNNKNETGIAATGKAALETALPIRNTETGSVSLPFASIQPLNSPSLSRPHPAARSAEQAVHESTNSDFPSRPTAKQSATESGETEHSVLSDPLDATRTDDRPQPHPTSRVANISTTAIKDQNPSLPGEIKLAHSLSPSTNVSSIVPLPDQSIANSTAVESFTQLSPGALSTAVNEQVAVAVRQTVMSASGTETQTISLKLNPAELGTIQIQVEQSPETITATIVAAEFATGEMLLANQEHLVESLVDLGFSETNLDIRHGESQTNDRGDTAQADQRQERRQSKQKQFTESQSGNDDRSPRRSADNDIHTSINIVA